MPRAWLTPNSPAPSETRCRTISVPDDLAFVSAVTGALLPLTQADQWEEYGTMTSEEASDIMSDAFEAFVASECNSVCPPFTLPNGSRIWRRNPTTGNFEYLDDTGEEWIEPTGEDAIPSPTAREELTSDEMKCAAASNAVDVLKTLYDQILADINDEVDTIQMGLNLAYVAGTRLGGAFYPPIVAILTSAAAIWNGVIEIIQAFTVNLWNDTFTDALVCIFLENSTETAGVVSFDFQAINRGILETIWEDGQYVLLASQVIYLMTVIGEQGVNVAGGTTAVEGSCNDCGNWFYTFDFTNDGSQEWVAIRETSQIYSAPGVFNGAAWVQSVSIDAAGSYGHKVMLGRRFEATTLTGVKVTFNRTNGQIVYSHYANRFITNRWDAGVSTGTETTLRANLTPGSTGTGLTLENTGEWENVNALSIALSASNRAGAVPNPVGTIAITRISLSGIGNNPFGMDNCTELI